MHALYNLFYVFFIFNIVIIGLYRYDYLLKINKILDTIYYRIMGNHVTIGTSFLVEKLLKNKNKINIFVKLIVSSLHSESTI